MALLDDILDVGEGSEIEDFWVLRSKCGFGSKVERIWKSGGDRDMDAVVVAMAHLTATTLSLFLSPLLL